jgi:hypothetical protein
MSAFDMLSGRAVPDVHFVPGFRQIRCHRPPHDAEPQKRNPHPLSPRHFVSRPLLRFVAEAQDFDLS